MEKDRRQGQSGRSRFDGNARPRVERSAGTPGSAGAVAEPAAMTRTEPDASARSPSDRKSVVGAQSGSVRVDIGGGRSLNKHNIHSKLSTTLDDSTRLGS